MAILVCGRAGYIGAHVNKEISRLGYKTVVVDTTWFMPMQKLLGGGISWRPIYGTKK